MSRAEPLSFYERAGRYLGTEIHYFTWQENPRLRRRLTGPQWRRLQHKGRSPRGNRTYYQHAPNKGNATPRQRKQRCGLRPYIFRSWFGTGNQSEHEKAAALPLCGKCEAKAGETEGGRQ